ncbi:MAG: L-threonylcarbamoyladenylate synthase [Dehalococcoidia bacterium]|nr:L-threonylcarbamoyladenylate synthase [Dehalococcoidia bacterium]
MQYRVPAVCSLERERVSATLVTAMQCCTWIGQLVANSLDRQVRYAVYVLSQGGVVAVPTDTVYGLAADARSADAVRRVVNLKDRSPDLPLPLLVADVAQAEAIAGPLSGAARALAARFWPGALTLVLPTSIDLPTSVVRDGAVGLRVPDDPICCRVIQLFGGPVTGTSANLTGKPPAMTPDEVRKQFGKRIDYILEAGRAGGALPSTVVRVSDTDLAVLRSGAVVEEDVRAVWETYRLSQQK